MEAVYQKSNWDEARKYCQHRLGDLLEIRTQDLQDSVVAHLKASPHQTQHAFWFGATDRHSETHWKWLRGNNAIFAYLFLLSLKEPIFTMPQTTAQTSVKIRIRSSMKKNTHVKINHAVVTWKCYVPQRERWMVLWLTCSTDWCSKYKVQNQSQDQGFQKLVWTVGQDKVSGRVSVLCWHNTPISNVLWKPLGIIF